jgi:predicted nucleotidyltransferase
MTEAVQSVRAIVVPILRRHGVTRAGVFGSCARGEMGSESDFDVLVEIGKDAGLLDLIAIKQELEEALGRTVDLVEYDAIKPLLKERVLREEVAIL